MKNVLLNIKGKNYEINDMWIMKDIMQYIKIAVGFLVACTNEINFAVSFTCVYICEHKLLIG
jgi:hypothetical protein